MSPRHYATDEFQQVENHYSQPCNSEKTLMESRGGDPDYLANPQSAWGQTYPLILYKN